jgi:glycosyltransferase involved in cell wall biosynthesis
MRVAIDISPISKSSTSAHRVRGVGAYINMLVRHLPEFDKENDYVFVEDKNFPSDVDLIHYPYFDPFFLTLPSKFKAKTVVTVHDLTPLVFPQHFPAGVRGKIKWLIQRSRLKKADLIITDSDCSKKDVERITGISKNKIQTVYLAANPIFKKLSIAKKLSLPENFLLYVGDATWNKNLPGLIRAVKRTNYPLALVGKIWEIRDVREVDSNPWNEDLRWVLREIENDEQFIRAGFVEDEDLVKIYNTATALIMPSIYEGFGLPVLEAMNCGCPVITTYGGSLPEVAGDAALYIDAENEKSIIDGIEKIFAEPNLRKNLSKKGLEQAGKFSIKKMIKDTVNAYEKACG